MSEIPPVVYGRNKFVGKDTAVPEGGLKVGMGGTKGIGSDRYPFTVVEVINDKKVVVQEDNAKRIDENGPFTESQQYEYSPNPNAERITVTRRQDGAWRRVGDTKGGARYSFHGRSAYQDPCF